ncbi:TlpA family protein disulfide reductase [Capsulimonas corticalis]|uniref:TlpA family protein disulfide reductase n=1 Tax=Capsulimonas corticalis TaxID=2219043 RepID=UPI000E646874|nr:TlpA disulfide reductase family protein [Capsulimonas corticalis]
MKPRNILGLLVATAFFSPNLHSLRAAEIRRVAGSDSADRAWRALKHDQETPPEPLKQLADRMYSQKEIRDYYARTAERAGAVADEAKQFYAQYPKYPQAVSAREIYFDMLHAAVALSSTTKIAELEAATAERLKDPKIDDAARFQLSLRLLQSAVSGRQYESDDAMRAELERRARRLAQDYPGHPDGDKYLLNLARAAATEKSAALAREILARSRDEKIKAECQGLIRRSAAVNKPLALTLTLSDGKAWDLKQWRGKVALLLFWDSSSRFSPKALWAVNELYKKYHAKGLEVVGLNFDEDQAKATAALKDITLEWPQYRDVPAGRTVQARFGVDTLPMCWFVDKTGVLRERYGERDPDGFTQRLLAE